MCANRIFSGRGRVRSIVEEKAPTIRYASSGSYQISRQVKTVCQAGKNKTDDERMKGIVLLLTFCHTDNYFLSKK